MHPFHSEAIIETPRGPLARWGAVLGVLHAVGCAVGLTLHLL
jgi:hypothetical protein